MPSAGSLITTMKPKDLELNCTAGPLLQEGLVHWPQLYKQTVPMCFSLRRLCLRVQLVPQVCPSFTCLALW